MIRYEDFTLALTADGKEIEVWASPFGRGVRVPRAAEPRSEVEAFLRQGDLPVRNVRRRFVPVEISNT